MAEAALIIAIIAQAMDSPAIAPDAIGITKRDAFCGEAFDQSHATSAPMKNAKLLAHATTHEIPNPIAEGT